MQKGLDAKLNRSSCEYLKARRPTWMILVLLKGGFEFSGLVATAISFGRSARQNKANPWPIGRRADEFDAGGFKSHFDIEQGR